MPSPLANRPPTVLPSDTGEPSFVVMHMNRNRSARNAVDPALAESEDPPRVVIHVQRGRTPLDMLANREGPPPCQIPFEYVDPQEERTGIYSPLCCTPVLISGCFVACFGPASVAVGLLAIGTYGGLYRMGFCDV